MTPGFNSPSACSILDWSFADAAFYTHATNKQPY